MDGMVGGELARRVFGPRPVNQAGVDLIKAHEGLRLEAYVCPGRVLTIGYGHTRGVTFGMRITQDMAEIWLAEDLRRVAGEVEALLKVPVSDNQFAALVSFAFNVGVENFSGSTLLRLLNRGWYEQVPAQLLRWVYAKGEALGGLARRRAAEARLWNTADIPQDERT